MTGKKLAHVCMMHRHRFVDRRHQGHFWLLWLSTWQPTTVEIPWWGLRIYLSDGFVAVLPDWYKLTSIVMELLRSNGRLVRGWI